MSNTDPTNRDDVERYLALISAYDAIQDGVQDGPSPETSQKDIVEQLKLKGFVESFETPEKNSSGKLLHQIKICERIVFKGSLAEIENDTIDLIELLKKLVVNFGNGNNLDLDFNKKN